MALAHRPLVSRSIAAVALSRYFAPELSVFSRQAHPLFGMFNDRLWDNQFASTMAFPKLD